MQIAIVLYPDLTVLDAIGPYQVLAQVPGADVRLCAPDPGTVVDDLGLLRLDVVHALCDVERPDVVVVPGGFGSRREAVEGGPIVEWLRAVHPRTTFTTSVCTGSMILGAAGILDGLTATTHWRYVEELRRFGATPTDERVVFDGRVVTAAGVSSGIDMALALVGRLAGDDLAEAIQLGIECDPQPPYDSGAPQKAGDEIRELVHAAMGTYENEVAARAIG
ncbi:MAG: DJ-1/PfpI family protein [Actinomycetota bacterium]|nr:DJ-1/PfpI family protein [Actinomycetota bacterium]